MLTKVGFQTNLGTPVGDQAATAGYDDRFVAWQADADYQYRTKGDWIVRARLSGQYSPQQLLPVMQLGAGGRTTVRGFVERAIASDKGILGNLELYTPQFAPGSRFLLFLDGASMQNNYSGSKHQNISSWGVGYRYGNPKNLRVALDYADIIKDMENAADQQHKRWNATVSAEF
ncbi:MAG: ShlB/FhaC/HecB family hemolysin secretion/activation protein [Selenomonadaceae bacterium]|nr:ShlB/FhaC/HecB family hemolysin secretion/activation protein [Selenomonadaceae bacterium]